MAEPDDFDSLPTQPWTGPHEPSPPFASPAPNGPGPRRGGWQPPTPEALQPSFPQYELRGVLGRGGMGAVYQGWQKSLDRFVAIKILPPQIEDNDANFAERFKREAKAMARFAHPGIVTVFDAGETADGLLYFIMEYVEGTDVQKMVAAQGPLPPEHALAITAHVCDALAYAHKRGVIHRDIKPSNIMVDAEGQVKVADFGLAKVASDDSAALVTGSHISMGTPDFMAPEAMLGMGHVDHRADLYAVGVMLYQMLTGQLPRGRFELPSVKRPGLDARFDAIVDRALQTDPEKRYASATEIRTDLDRILTEPVPHASAAAQQPPPAAPPPQAAVMKISDLPTPKKSKLPLFAGLAGATVAVVIGGLFLVPKLQLGHAPGPGSSASPTSHHEAGASPAEASPSRSLGTRETLEPSAIKLWDTPEKVPAKPRVRWENNALRIDNDSVQFNELGDDKPALTNPKPSPVSRDAIVRGSVKLATGSAAVGLRNHASAGGGHYRVNFDAGGMHLDTVQNRQQNTLDRRQFTKAHGIDDWIHFEMRVVGDQITFTVEGEEPVTVTDSSIPEAGGVMLYTSNTAWFRDIVYVPLDKTSASTPANATKDAPFVNSLGMKFVPVPGTQALFSIWDTRVQDYAAYARVNKLDSAWTRQEKDGVPVSREPEYPVVGVSWDDANAFCQWLTEKESAEGKLPQGMNYRLPTDKEWSRAVGLAKEEGATPEERSGKNNTDFPWGIGFPPPRGEVGNYADAAFHEKFPQEKWIEGYADGYATTSPVGSFSPNAYGLRDMGGNVLQWCEDLNEPGSHERVLRGASWDLNSRGYLLSSHRAHNPPVARNDLNGFRCVLAPAASTPPSPK